jgi:acetyl-CoA carboxylase carboxyltransferase component
LPEQPPARDPSDLYGVLPADHRLPYEVEEIIFRIFDAGDYDEFQPEYAPEMLCANTRLSGRPVAIIANRRGFLKTGGRPRIGGIVYTESARKVAYFVDAAERTATPLIYLQDVSGFMVGPEAEREGIIRAGAEMVETMSCATVPRIIVTINHASGAGYYAMAGQGFDPNFAFSWPTARIGVMEGDSAVFALYSAELEKHKGGPLPEDLEEAIGRTRADYERWLDARYAAARGHCDAVIDPLDTRQVLTQALEACMYNRRAAA